MHSDVDAADRVLIRLSDLLRMTLENMGQQEITLQAEPRRRRLRLFAFGVVR